MSNETQDLEKHLIQMGYTEVNISDEIEIRQQIDSALLGGEFVPGNRIRKKIYFRHGKDKLVEVEITHEKAEDNNLTTVANLELAASLLNEITIYPQKLSVQKVVDAIDRVLDLIAKTKTNIEHLKGNPTPAFGQPGSRLYVSVEAALDHYQSLIEAYLTDRATYAELVARPQNTENAKRFAELNKKLKENNHD